MENKPIQKRRIDWARYVVSFIITAAIFMTVILVSRVVNEKKIASLQTLQDKIAIDLLSSETQFSLLSSSGCTSDGNSILTPEIGEMGDRLSYMEGQLGPNNTSVIGLKEYYSLLEIKDYLLVNELASKCHNKSMTLVYFYSNNNCPDCDKQGYVLTALREQYPALRVYSFDADLDVSAIKTLQTITKVPGTLPSIVINGHVYGGFQSLDDIQKNEPGLAKLNAATPAQTSASNSSAHPAATTSQ